MQTEVMVKKLDNIALHSHIPHNTFMTNFSIKYYTIQLSSVIHFSSNCAQNNCRDFSMKVRY